MLSIKAICIYAFTMSIGLLEFARLSSSCLPTYPADSESTTPIAPLSTNDEIYTPTSSATTAMASVINSMTSTTHSAFVRNNVSVIADMCLECICELESAGCTPIGCVMDEGSLSCGYFQLKLEYYEDCGEPGIGYGESVEDAWMRCTEDLACSIQCVNNYISRFSDQCPNKSGCEKIARLHNSGPDGCNISRSDGYWNIIMQCLASFS